jgi:hypothetical protein
VSNRRDEILEKSLAGFVGKNCKLAVTATQRKLLSSQTEQALGKTQLKVAVYDVRKLTPRQRQLIAVMDHPDKNVLTSHLLPFGLIESGSGSATSIAYGEDGPFQEEMGIGGHLCFDLARGTGLSAPVVWCYRQEVFPWSDDLSSLALKVVKKV